MKEVQREKLSKVYLVTLIQKRAQMEPPHHWLNTKDTRVILSVDRLGKQKNFPLLIHTLALVVQKCPARLIILGEGPYLKRLAKNLIFVEYVDILGLSANYYTYIGRSNVLALSSSNIRYKNRQ